MTTVSLSMRIFLVLIVLFAIIFFATKLMENNKLKKERDALQDKIRDAKQKVSDLQYGIDAPVDESYIEDWGKDNGFEYPDATVYIPNS
jgi:cell division protein FtsL